VDNREKDVISVIIPVLNEETALPTTLNNVFSQSAAYEIIVVDGGSDDSTCDIVKKVAEIKLITTSRGRARQMNAGASISKGQWLLFLHADTLLPEDGLLKIESLDTKIQAGCFHQWFSGDHWLLRFISRLHNWRCSWTHIIYGDQAMFIRRDLFDKLGGFTEEPIMEDVIFSEKLKKLTRPILLDERVITDSRKFVQRGIWRSFMEVAIILICYELRLPIMAKGFFSPIR